MHNKLSIVIPTYNCGNKLKRCLESVKWANEIIIVDMESTDDTVLVTKRYSNVKVYTRIPFDGNFDKNRKFGMEKATGNWLLKLDSDEVLTSDLHNEIIDTLNYKSEGINGYFIMNKIMMFGHEIKHGFVKKGSNELRLVRNGFWQYNPYKFHQNIEVTGKKAFLKNYYTHFNFESVVEFINKTNKYTDLDSKYYSFHGANIYSAIVAPIKTFINIFILKCGFLDRFIGFQVSYLFSIYNLIEKIKVVENQQKS